MGKIKYPSNFTQEQKDEVENAEYDPEWQEYLFKNLTEKNSRMEKISDFCKDNGYSTMDSYYAMKEFTRRIEFREVPIGEL